MTVSELIEHLKQFHPDLPVYVLNDEENYVDILEAEDVYKDRVRGCRINHAPGISHEAVII